MELSLRDLQNQAAIRELLYDWCYVVDNGLWDRYETMFVKDADIDFSSIGSRGTDPASHRQFLENLAWPATKAQHHVLGNLSFLELGPDSARTRSLCLASVVMLDDTCYTIGVYYHDWLQLHGGEWLIAKKHCEKVFFNPPNFGIIK